MIDIVYLHTKIFAMTSTIFLICSIALVAFVQGQKPIQKDALPVLLRVFSDFGTIYRPVPIDMMSKNKMKSDDSFDYYNITFSTSEFSQISESSLTMLNCQLEKRNIIHHADPNFELVGSTYLYRRHVEQDEPIEIELINPKERLFREVGSKRYFYLSSNDNVQYLRKAPIVPYYEVLFQCQRESMKRMDDEEPVITYHDRSLAWSTRYVMRVANTGVSTNVPLEVYADIRNRGERTLEIRHIELAAGEVKLLGDSDRNSRSVMSNFRSNVGGSSIYGSSYQSDSAVSVSEQASGVYLYDVKSLGGEILYPQSVKSVRFIEGNMTVKSFVLYSVAFSTSNSQNKLIRAYNISSNDAFLPAGRWLLHENGQFAGEFDLEALARSEIYTMKFGVDPDVMYRRTISLLERNDMNETITYKVNYSFINTKRTRDLIVDFRESFSYEKYFEMKTYPSEVSLSLYGNVLRGEFSLPSNQIELKFSYEVIIHSKDPTQQRQ